MKQNGSQMNRPERQELNCPFYKIEYSLQSVKTKSY